MIAENIENQYHAISIEEYSSLFVPWNMSIIMVEFNKGRGRKNDAPLSGMHNLQSDELVIGTSVSLFDPYVGAHVASFE